MSILCVIVVVCVVNQVEAQMWAPERRAYPIGSYGDPYAGNEYVIPYDHGSVYSGYPPAYGTTGLSQFQRRPLAYSATPTAAYSPIEMPMIANGGGVLPLGGRAQEVALASLMNYVTDKDNFQPQGCSWDGGRNRCTDVLNQCKGICRDFANDVVTHDCRCVPFGYAALVGWQN